MLPEAGTGGTSHRQACCPLMPYCWPPSERTLASRCANSASSSDRLRVTRSSGAVGSGTAGGITMLVLDKTFSDNYQRLGEVTEKFMGALKERKEVSNLFTFYAANYPQYEIIINNDVAMQKGVSIKAAMDSLNILIGSTWEQGFIRFNFFYKVFVQAKPEFRRYLEDLDNLFVKNDKGDMVPYSAFMRRDRKSVV